MGLFMALLLGAAAGYAMGVRAGAAAVARSAAQQLDTAERTPPPGKPAIDPALLRPGEAIDD